ncbi:MAG: hypothetical protein PVG53_05445 [Holophagae bacterium]|jgi:hypothetical protein
MVLLLPPGTTTLERTVAAVFDHLTPEVRNRVAVLYLDDGSGEWWRSAVERPAEERRRSVLAAVSHTALADAVRLGIGGALLQPVSTPALALACDVAAGAHGPTPPAVVGTGVVDAMVASVDALHAIGWFPRGFWTPLLGDRSMIEILHGIAARIPGRRVVADWPALLVADQTADELGCAIDAATGDIVADAPEAPTVVDLGGCLDADDPAAAMLARLAEIPSDRPAPPAVSRSVHELPSGHRVGVWRPFPCCDQPVEGWSATPVDIAGAGHCWRIDRPGGDSTMVVDTLVSGPDDGTDRSVLRVPGWIGAEIGPGRPAGVLIERLASSGERDGRPLWVSNVDHAGVQFLLGLPAPIWVDGPGVPV